MGQIASSRPNVYYPHKYYKFHKVVFKMHNNIPLKNIVYINDTIFSLTYIRLKYHLIH